MATHVIRSPPSGTGSGSGSGSGSGTGGREQVYQSTNPCLSISSETVLGIARLERYVPFKLVALYPCLVFLPLFPPVTFIFFRIMATNEAEGLGRQEAKRGGRRRE